MNVRPFTEADRVWAEPFQFPAGPPHRVVSRGVLRDPFDLPALVAEVDGHPAGLATYRVDPPECELFTLGSLVENAGAGTALVEGVAAAARAAGCSRLFVITTNDNTHAIRFYQRRGFRLREVRVGAIDDYRFRLKPEIPLRGNDGIRISDELEFVMDLEQGDATTPPNG